MHGQTYRGRDETWNGYDVKFKRQTQHAVKKKNKTLSLTFLRWPSSSPLERYLTPLQTCTNAFFFFFFTFLYPNDNLLKTLICIVVIFIMLFFFFFNLRGRPFSGRRLGTLGICIPQRLASSHPGSRGGPARGGRGKSGLGAPPPPL